jgi:hypothetical protein
MAERQILAVADAAPQRMDVGCADERTGGLDDGVVGAGLGDGLVEEADLADPLHHEALHHRGHGRPPITAGVDSMRGARSSSLPASGPWPMMLPRYSTIASTSPTVRPPDRPLTPGLGRSHHEIDCGLDDLGS